MSLFRRIAWIPAGLAALGLAPGGQEEADPGVPGRPPDVLLIVVDDLNDWVGHLGGHPAARTPNLDRLAERGAPFLNAHCVSPVCNASRTAMLGGVRPRAKEGRKPSWRAVLKGVTTLPEHFARHGYELAGAGKVFHGDNDKVFDEYFAGRQRDPRSGAGGRRTFVGLNVPGERSDVFDWAGLDVEDDFMADHQVATWACERLQEVGEAPLFLAVGFSKPHLPWYLPSRFFELHDPEGIELPEVRADDHRDLPPVARALVPERVHAEILARGVWKSALQAYLAAVSFVDFELGRLLDALEGSPRAERTIVVLVSDHGFHLGGKSHWRKFSLWEESTRIPLVFAGPGVARVGVGRAQPVDALSIYPTLCDLAGLPTPAHVEGVSVRPLLDDPRAPWPHAALTTYQEHHALRTDRWRFILYGDGAAELYDHDADPGEFENLAGLFDHRATEAELRERLSALVAR